MEADLMSTLTYPGLTLRRDLFDPWRFACEWRAKGFAVWDQPECRCVEVSATATVYGPDGQPRQLSGAAYNTLWGDWSI
jgi:hypothetical protein